VYGATSIIASIGTSASLIGTGASLAGTGARP
jgi:hypothetical protein